MAMGQERSARLMFGYIKELDSVLLYCDIYSDNLFVGRLKTGHHSAAIGKE